MGGARCSYKNCTARSHPKAKGENVVRMFHYPVSNEVRCYQWLENAQKLHFLSLLKSQLRNRVICQHHFREDNFNNRLKNSLKCDAVPTLDGPYCGSSQMSHSSHSEKNNQYSLSSVLPMCDENEIEIEEHDVLDNPTIRRIFPDLSIIKKEISQYEQGLMCSAEETAPEVIAQQQVESIASPHLESKLQETIQNSFVSSETITEDKSQEITKQTPIDTRLATHLRFKTFLDSLADDFSNIDNNTTLSATQSDTVAQPFTDNTLARFRSLTEIKTENKEYKCVRNNIFILGSKPNLKDSKLSVGKIKELKVVLKDVSSYLNMSKQYCKQCLILFPNIHASKSHLTKTHSSVQKNLLNKNKSQDKIKLNSRIKCKICKVSKSFSTVGNLSKHMKIFHKTDFVKNIHASKNSVRRTTRNVKSNSILNDDTGSKSPKNHCCFHCTKVFETSSLLIEHLYDVITPNYTDSAHPKEAKEKLNVADETTNNDSVPKKVTCSMCLLKFSTQRDLDQHTKTAHANNKSTSNNKSSNKRQNSQQSNSLDQNLFDSTLNDEKESKVKDNTAKSECIENKINEINNTYDLETDNMDDLHYTTDDGEHETSIANSETKVEEKQMYQCFVCSKYITYLKWYSVHMLGHNIKITSEMEKTAFNSQCKFCNFKNANIKHYNKHISNEHPEKKKKKIKLDDKAFQSVLFKCLRCNIFFLSANAARSHSEHKAIFVDWKCSKCERTFKVKDKSFHLKQHSVSENIITYTISESGLNRLLYKCLKCAVHFSEREYFLHSATCVLNAPNSSYCNACDILINRSDMVLHKRYHKDKKLQPLDFTFIESDYFVNDVKKNTDEKINLYAHSKFALTFCYTCNCFVGNLGRKRKAHIEGRCGIICQRMCKQCGLIFTHKGYLSHKMLHDKTKDLTLQTFYFYDIKSKKQMRPPLPKYPSCSICNIHFLNKKVIREHECHRQKFTTCNICKIKLTETAFRLHMNFHNYKLSDCNKKLVIRYKHENALASSAVSNISDSDDSSAVNNDVLNMTKKVTVKQCDYLYICTSCRITVQDYDKVVQHCHDHYDAKVVHANYYENTTSDDERLDVSITFDPFYLRFDNDVWIKHIFGHLTQEQINKIVEKSIYNLECRLKMDVIQTGTSRLALYKCDVCRSYIDPNTLYLHASNTCNLTKKHPCSHCGLCFYSQSYLNVHEKIHKRPGINLASYKIILFNKTEYQYFSKIMFNSLSKFVLYICRNCEVVVDKIQRDNHQCSNASLSNCSYCGLLFYGQDYNSHLDKHNTIANFNTENMIVIKFGKSGVQKKDASRMSFNGIVYDLTFYKCGDCGLCLSIEKERLEHVCVSKSSISLCPKCYLCILNENFEEHLQLHEKVIEIEYEDFNYNIIDFNSSAIERNNIPRDLEHKSTEIEHSSFKETGNNNIEENVMKNEAETCITQTLYKCKCGLHFLEEKNLIKHSNSCHPRGQKISKQNCFRCSLLFTPGELFDHLLKHHSDKKVQYKYDIITIS